MLTKFFRAESERGRIESSDSKEREISVTDEDLAAHLAEEAGRLLLEQRHTSLLAGSALGHAPDLVLIDLPSSSPAFASLSFEKKRQAWLQLAACL
jgi:G:T/U-mismatch repair DNA glycosylase